jgi:hypothetical protein
MQRTGGFPRNVQQCVFGRNPALYDRTRLPCATQVFEILTDRCGLGPGTTLFETGPGTGLATRELLSRGASRLVLIEADGRLARFLRKRLARRGADFTILASPFEETLLPRREFDLGVAASSFHWLPPRKSLRMVGRAHPTTIRPGTAPSSPRHPDPATLPTSTGSIGSTLRISFRNLSSPPNQEANDPRRLIPAGRIGPARLLSSPAASHGAGSKSRQPWDHELVR